MRENKDVGTPRHMMSVAFFGLVWFLSCVCCVSCITVEQLMWHCGVGRESRKREVNHYWRRELIRS